MSTTINSKRLSTCPYCGGELAVTNQTGGYLKYQCRSCHEEFTDQGETNDKGYLFACYTNAVIALYYNPQKSQDMWNSPELRDKYEAIVPYSDEMISKPYFAIVHTLYLSCGFTKYSRRLKGLIEIAKSGTATPAIKVLLTNCDDWLRQRSLEKQQKSKRKAIVSIALVLLLLLLLVGGALLYQPSFYDDATGIFVNVPYTQFSIWDKFIMSLQVEELPETTPAYIDAKHALRREATKFHLYDISIKSGSGTWNINGVATITMPIPEDCEMGNLAVYQILSKDEFKKISPRVSAKDRTISFEVDQFGIYAIAEHYPKVTFNTMGGSALEDQFVKRGELIQKPADPSKNGYSFQGWTHNGMAWDFEIDTVTEDITLVAVWKASEYTIRYETNGGEAISAGKYTTGQTLALPTPVRNGYEFIGWCDDQSLSGDSFTSLPENVFGDKTFYAKWSDPISYSATFDTKGGNPLNAITFTVESSPIVLPNSPQRAHYTFDGWYDNENYQGESVTTIPTGSLGNRTYYAKWTPVTYTITLLFQDTNNTRQTLTYTVEKAAVLPYPEPKPNAEYAFDDWYSDSSCTTPFVNDLATTPRNLTLYGNWTREFFVVTFNANGGTVESAKKSVAHGKAFGTLPTPTREYYTFLGWFTTAEGNNGTRITETSMPTSTNDITLYARWERDRATLIFNANEGSVSPASKDLLCGEPYGDLPTPTRTNYVFLGWYTAQTDGTLVTKATLCKTKGNVTLYAHWKLDTITLLFKPEGGTVSKESQTVIAGQAYGTLPTPTRDYFNFTGWYTAQTGGVEVTSATIASAGKDVTLYARWAWKDTVTAPAASLPSGAQVLNRWWTYTRTQKQESPSTSMSGWTLTGTYWAQYASTSFDFAENIPSGFDTTHSLYTTLNKEPYEDKETETYKRTVTITPNTGYVYWHWMYNSTYSTGTKRTIADKKCIGTNDYAFHYFYAIASTVDCPLLTDREYVSGYVPGKAPYTYNCKDILPASTGSKDGMGTPRMLRFPYSTCTYTEYCKIFQYQKVTNGLTSSTKVTAGGEISNVQEMVEYRPK